MGMYTIMNRLFIFIALIFVSLGICAQQVTKEQLLKLFYKAQTALNKGETENAVNAYIEILKLSPGLPDTYLQLGDIYSTMTTDVVAMEKACICYANYLQLRPEATDAELLKTKISDLTLKIQQIQGKTNRISADLQGLVKSTPVLFAKDMLVELPKKVDKVEVPFVKEIKDSVPSVVDTAKVMRVFKMDDALLGRWASASLGDNGREDLILDISKKGKNYYILVNDSSFIIKKDEMLRDVLKEKVQMNFVDNEMVVTYITEQKKLKADKLEHRGLGALRDWFNGVDLFSTTNDRTMSNDTLVNSDSIVVEPIFKYSYQFRLTYDGFKLSGSMSYKVLRRDTVETLLSETNNDYELFKAPDDYLGFTYKPVITANEKASKIEFRRLFNQKFQESVDNVMALNDLGCMYVSGLGTARNMKMAVAIFGEASQKNNMYGILNFAKLYEDGIGVEKNLEEARKLYKQAFEKGFTDAMVMCGDTYLVSAVSDDDYKKALDCYLSAFYKRCPYAYYRLGWLYKEGLGVEIDLPKALEYYQRAVDMQFPDALVEMGLFYKEGDMVDKNITKALELLTKAAEKGHANAMYQLYEIFLRGDDGVKPDFKYAKDWYFKYMRANDKVIDGYNTIKSQVKTILSPK